MIAVRGHAVLEFGLDKSSVFARPAPVALEQRSNLSEGLITPVPPN